MSSYDFAALEHIEFAACEDLYRAAPDAVRAEHAVDVRHIGEVICLTCRGIEPTPVFRRAVGLGVRRAATASEIDDVVTGMARLGMRYAVPIAAQAQPSSLASQLESRGFSKGYAWMKFFTRCDSAPSVETRLDVRVVGREHADEFGRVVAAGFGLPPLAGQWIGAIAGRKNWVCVMAFAGTTAVATGAVYVHGEYAWLGFGATAASHRRQGAQSALLAWRLEEAAAHGARIGVTETGELLPDKPSNSYRNIMRIGFVEAYLRQNYMSPTP